MVQQIKKQKLIRFVEWQCYGQLNGFGKITIVQIITCPLDAALEKTNHLDRVIGQLLGTSLIGCNMMGQNTHLSTRQASGLVIWVRRDADATLFPECRFVLRFETSYTTKSKDLEFSSG